MTLALELDPGKDPFVRRMALACLAGLGGFLLWGALAPLEEGVAARGRIVAETERQVIQHLEGGIIRDLRVREGARVRAGDILVVLEDTSPLAGRDQVIQEYAALMASTQRLAALQSGQDAADFSQLERLEIGADERADIMAREEALFRQQKQALAADLAVLASRRDAAVATQDSRRKESAIVERALKAARRELAVRRDMFAEQLVRLDQVTAAEREAARLEAEVARLASDRQAAAAEEADLAAQIEQANARFAQEIAQALLETRGEFLSVEEKLRAAQDVLDRSVIRAPVSGQVLNLNFATIGGVVRPGEAMMEIIPERSGIAATIRIRPTDRASVYEGQTVRTQLAAYRSWSAPRLAGEVIGVSADLKTDPATSAVYYEARIIVQGPEAERVKDLDIEPGMPVDVFIYSGRSRTFLDYVIEPLGESLFRGLRSS